MKKSRLKELYYGIDGVLLLIALLLLSVSLYFFFQDDGLRGADNMEMTPVGKFVQSHNDVRRRVQSGFSWSNVSRTPETVFEGDSIFTGEGSGAAIDMIGGGQLSIDAKSLVVVHTKGKKLSLDLQYGSMTGKVNASESLLITQNGQTQEVSGNGAEIRIESSEGSKETKIHVLKGQIKVKKVVEAKPNVVAAPVEEQTINQSEVLDVGSTSKAVVQKVEAELLAPTDGRLAWVAPSHTEEFKWKLVNRKTDKTGAKPAMSQIQFSKDREFRTPFFTTSTNDTTFELMPEKRPSGKFYWRVQVLDDDQKVEGLPSAPASLTLNLDVPPTPVIPSEEQSFSFEPKTGEKGKQISLTWQDQANSSSYSVQMAADTTFEKPLFEKSTKEMSEQTALLPAGSYYWRVKGLDPQRTHSDYSRPIHFTVDTEAHQPDAPKLAEKELHYEIPEKVLAHAPANVKIGERGVAAEGIKPFTWKTVSEAESYEVELASNDQFANPIKHSTGTNTSFAPQEVEPGTLYVRVRARGRKGLVSAPSETSRLEVSVPAPVLKDVPPVTDKFPSAAELDSGRHDFEFSWNPRPFAETYELDWGADETFQQAKKFRLKTTSRSIAVTKPQDYAIRVRALGPDGIAISPYSAVKVAKYRKELATPVAPKPAPLQQAKAPLDNGRTPAGRGAAILSGPTLIEPLKDSSFVSIDDSVPYVNLRWKTMKDATGYELQMAQDADFTQIVFTSKPSKSAYLVQKALPEGRIFWRVRAILAGGKGNSDWSSVNNLNVLYQ